MPPIQSLEIGDAIEVEGRFTNTSGAATNPTTWSVLITKPDGTTVTVSSPNPSITNPATGVFRYIIVADMNGAWQYRWSGTGAVVSGETGYFVVGSKVRSGPCSAWASVGDLDECFASLSGDEGAKQRALDAATDLLFRWSGYRYPGLCRDVVRPCAQLTSLDSGWYAAQAYAENYYGWSPLDAWGGCACQSDLHGGGCGCQTLSEISLSRIPIQGIVEIRIDGAVLAPSAYRVDDQGTRLVRIDGNVWPCCQDLTADPATDANTFQVDFIWGVEPTSAGVNACLHLASEFVKACSGADCGLDPNVVTLARQDTTLQFIRPGEFGRDLNGNIKTGNKVVDAFLAAYPQREPGLLVSPESIRPVVRHA